MPTRFNVPGPISWQQLEPVLDPPGIWRSQGVEPQFRLACRLPPGWVRVHFRMHSQARARFEFFADRGEGLDTGACIQRNSFIGSTDDEFFVNLPWEVFGFRFDPLDMEGQFRLDTLEIQSVSRLYLLLRSVRAVLSRACLDWRTLASITWAVRMLLTGRLGAIKMELLANLKGHSILAPPPQDVNAVYAAWLDARRRTAADGAVQSREPLSAPVRPLLSLILPVADQPEDCLRRTITSVVRQTSPGWELSVADYGLTSAVRTRLEEFAGRDPRIKLSDRTAPGHRTTAANAALGGVATEYVAILEPGDELAAHAVLRVAEAVRDAKERPDLLYSDEDRLTPDGRHEEPFFKPDWSPEYLLSWMYTGQLAVYRTEFVRALGGLRAEFEPSEDYDLVLRVAAETSRIRHIADVLYHRFRACPRDGTAEANRRALANHLDRTGRAGTVEPGSTSAIQRVRLAIAGRPKVSIIIPTAYRDRTVGGRPTTYLVQCLRSIRRRTRYSNYEILILDNGEAPAYVLKELATWDTVRTAYSLPFNWAATMNDGAARAKGAHLVFLDDDTKILTPDWLECLLEYSQQPQIGAVGARLHFPDGRLQHAGVTVVDGLPGHPFYGYPGGHPGYYFSNIVPRNYRAVTSACLMTRADVFRAVGGFREAFAVNFNDIDYCLRVGQAGLRVVCNPYAQLCHYESATKTEYSLAERQAFERHWRAMDPDDPYYNPNLSRRYHDYRLGEPCAR